MNSLEKYIDYNKLSSDEFEELCFELILKHGFSKVIWRKGGADNGRDIEGKLVHNNSLIGQHEEKYFFECKKYEKGVPPEKLYSKIAWADAEKPQHLIFMFTSYISNNGRTWLEKIEKDKLYKIHLLEGDELAKIISQHKDLVSKYFVEDKILNLLTETINKWILHNLIPNFYTYHYLLNKLEFENVTLSQKVFLYCLYFVHYSRLEELENENYHGIDISKDLELLANCFKENNNSYEPVLKLENDVDTLSSEGYLSFDWEEQTKNYDFIASEVLLNVNNREKYKLSYYLFKRLNKNEAIEILLYHNSNLEFKIRFIDSYEYSHFKESAKYLGMKEKFVNELIDNSENMK